MRLGIRWTVGDVHPSGFDALRLSLWGARRCFGPDAGYVVCVNRVPVEEALRRTGPVPAEVVWSAVTEHDLPASLRPFLDDGMAEGVLWKLAPLRVFPDRHELSLDNDVILWDVPGAVAAWLGDPDPVRCLLAADVTPAFGRFAEVCGEGARNTGIRGLPPFFDLEDALARMLRAHPGPLSSELDEQGLQVAAMSAAASPVVVETDEVSICSPFPPHEPHLGHAGAHFVGLNARRLSFVFEGRDSVEVRQEHWASLRPEVAALVGIAPLEHAVAPG